MLLQWAQEEKTLFSFLLFVHMTLGWWHSPQDKVTGHRKQREEIHASRLPSDGHAKHFAREKKMLAWRVPNNLLTFFDHMRIPISQTRKQPFKRRFFSVVSFLGQFFFSPFWNRFGKPPVTIIATWPDRKQKVLFSFLGFFQLSLHAHTFLSPYTAFTTGILNGKNSQRNCCFLCHSSVLQGEETPRHFHRSYQCHRHRSRS